MDDHQILSEAFLGSLLSSLLIFDWRLLWAAKAKKKKYLETSHTTELIDGWSPNFVCSIVM
jgi:hypothetical protein